jgi:two-component system, NarL family, nitrate/nitrite response regulator NarL
MTIESQSGNDGRNLWAPRRKLPSQVLVLPTPPSALVEPHKVDTSQSPAQPGSERHPKITKEDLTGNQSAEHRPLRLLVSDRTALGCELLLHSLSRRRDISVSMVGATSSVEVEHVARTQQPDIALVSAALSDGPLAGFRVLPILQSILPKCDVIMLLDDCDETLAVDAFRARARGVFYRADPMELLIKCICRVREGQVWVRTKELRAVLDAFADSSPFSASTTASTHLQLNEREFMVARLVATGQTNRQIARRLNLSEHTVKNYLYRLFEKLGVRSRVELAVLMMNEPVRNGTLG